MYSNSIKLIVGSKPVRAIFEPSINHEFIPSEKLFNKESFQKLSVDFNAVIGHVLGRLNLDYTATKLLVTISLKKDGVDYQPTIYGEKINPIIQSLLEKSEDISSTSIAFKTNEFFLDTPADTYYNLYKTGSLRDDKINAVMFLGRLRFKNTGTQNLSMILEEYLKRINNVIKKLVGGLNINE